MKHNLNDLTAFVRVAREGSFTKAAAQLGMSQSALSHTIRALEEQLGVRLLNRTTRRTSPSEVGARLLAAIGPRLDGIDADLAELSAMRDRPAGTIRITASEHATEALLMPRLMSMLRAYPDIQVEINTNYQMVDIVEERFDAGVRLGESVAKDMIAVRIGPDVRMAVVAAPTYFSNRAAPHTPQELTDHDCINVRLPTHGGLLPWDFKKDHQELNVRVNGTCIFNSFRQVVDAALNGMGLAFVLEEVVQEHLATGRLVRVLDDWCNTFAGYHLYYTSRRQPSAAFTLLVDTLRYRPDVQPSAESRR
jgi:DNA-binding transcriptional LysR family regulator